LKRLLIVDDDEAMRRLFRLNLSANFEIIDTGDPEQALALAMEHKPDAILMDLRMPNHSGLELCRAFGSISKTQPVPIFVVSGDTGIEAKNAFRQLGTAGYFEKPIDFDALRTSLAKVKRQSVIPRTEIRVQLRVAIRLTGKDIHGNDFKETTFTENVSISSFLCGCAAELQKDSIVNVYVFSGIEKYAGKARTVRSDPRQGASTLYAFRFLEKTGDWILK
jgi:DNA-binding response OmpR family regulator